MRKLFIAALLVTLLSSVHESSAMMPPPAVPAATPVYAFAPHYLIPAIGLAAGASYLILAQKDQYDEPIWHRLACGLFGDEGRVGNETDSACKHIE